MLRSLLRHAAFWVPFAATTYLAFTPNTEILPPQITDVIAHASAFFYLTMACWFVYYESNGGLAPVLWMAAYGIAIELIQSQLPERTFELKDLAVDAAGITAAWLVYRVGRGASKRGQTPL
jgi:VanZ family protein